MITRLIELTNSLSDPWFTWILSSLLETSGLLILIGIGWLVIHKRVAPQVGYCLFLLVPLKLLLPLNITVPAAIAQWSPSAVVPTWFDKRPETADIKTTPHSEMPDAATMVHEPDPAQADIVTESAHPSAIPISDLPTKTTSLEKSDRQPHTTTRPEVTAVRLSAKGSAMIAWLLTVTFLLTRLFLTQLRFRKRMTQLKRVQQRASGNTILDPSCDAHEPAVPSEVPDELRRRVGVTRNVRIILSDDVSSPAVWRIFRPVIILPKGIAATLSKPQLQWVLLHELAHIRRFDLLVVACQRLAAVLHFFNPAIWIANRMIHRLREYACDDQALSLSDGTAVDSGEAFLLILRQATRTKHQFGGALGVFGLDSRNACFARVHRLMDTERPLHVRPGYLSVIGLILLAAILLPRIHAGQIEDGHGPKRTEKQLVKPRLDAAKPEQQNKLDTDNKACRKHRWSVCQRCRGIRFKCDGT